MKVKTMVGILIFLIVLNIGVLGTVVYLSVTGKQPPVARFFNPEPRFEPPIAGQVDRIANLTAEQQQEMVLLVESYQSEVKPLQEEIQKAEHELFQQLMIQERVDSDRTEKILRNIADLRLQVSRHALESLEKSKTFLTEEQQEIFIRQIMTAGRRPSFGPGPNGMTPPMFNRPAGRR